METATLPPLFTPSPHGNTVDVANQNARLGEYPWFLTLCRTAVRPFFILNDEQQVIKANQAALELYALDSEAPLLGATLDRHRAGYAELVREDQHDYWLVCLDDERADTNRWALEKVFLHDILNTAGGVQGLSEVMAEATPDELPFLQETVRNLADQLVDEITAQRDFLSAENGDLIVEPKPVNACTVAKQVAERYRNHPVAEDRQIILASDTPIVFCVDPTLLARVLGNMVKNALESSPDADVVTIDYGHGGGRVWFSVHNPTFIPPQVQPHIFTRSYSTKGAGRGLGTYGMRLLSEQFMKGQVEFTTSAHDGTTFIVDLPDGPCS